MQVDLKQFNNMTKVVTYVFFSVPWQRNHMAQVDLH